jgi:hypothetical protein
MHCKPRAAIVMGCKKFLDKYVRGSELALVVSWWDIIVFAIFTMLMFMFLGPIVDQLYIYMNSTVNNSLTVGFYTTSDMNTVNDLYNIYQWIPYLCIGVIIFYALNYSNLKKGGE